MMTYDLPSYSDGVQFRHCSRCFYLSTSLVDEYDIIKNITTILWFDIQNFICMIAIANVVNYLQFFREDGNSFSNKIAVYEKVV